MMRFAYAFIPVNYVGNITNTNHMYMFLFGRIWFGWIGQVAQVLCLLGAIQASGQWLEVGDRCKRVLNTKYPLVMFCSRQLDICDYIAAQYLPTLLSQPNTL